jgi:RimJ/RimL family protein N-acetyltransferase
MTNLLTARLRLEPWRDEHVALLARFSALPEVMRHIGDGAVWGRADVDRHAQRVRDHWREHGFGWRCAIELAGDRPVGIVALNYAGPDTAGLAADEHEVGWWFDPAVWGRGYASEGARAIVAEAFGTLGAASVAARVQPANAASLRVAAAVGLEPVDEVVGAKGERIVILRRSASGG